MVERFEMPRSALNDIKNLSLDEQLVELDKLFNQMNMTNKLVEDMGNSSLGVINRIKEALSGKLRMVGFEALEHLKPVILDIEKLVSNGGLDKFFNRMGSVFAFLGQESSKFVEYIKANWSTIQNNFNTMNSTLSPIGDLIGFLYEKAKSLGDYIIQNFNTVIGVVMGVGGAFLAFKGIMATMAVIGTVTRLMTALRAGTLIATAAQWGLNIAMLANPVGLIILGIAALIGIIVFLAVKFEWVRNIFATTWEFLKSSFMAVMEWLKPYVTEAMNQVMSAFTAVKDYITQIMPMLQQIFGTYWAIYSAIFKFYLTTIWTIVSTAFKTIWNVISLVLKTIGNTIKLWWGIISGLFKVGLQLLTGDWSGAWETLKKTASGAIENMKKLFTDWIAGAVKIGKDFVQGIIDGFLGVWDSLKSTAQSIWDSVTGIFNKKQSVSVDVNRNFVDKYSVPTLPGSNRPNGSHYFGIDRIPYNGYLAETHEGEAILDKREADAWRKGKSGGSNINVSFAGANFNVRKESDIDSIANALVAKLIEAGELGA